MDEILKTLTITVVANGTVLGLFIWVFKKMFEASIAQRTKVYLAEIDLENKKNLHQFSNVFDKQAEVIEQVYSDLVKLSDQSSYLAHEFDLQERHPEFYHYRLMPKDGDTKKWEKYYQATLSEKPENIKAKELSEHASKSLNEFREKRIYFSLDVADSIEQYINIILFVASQFSNVNFRDNQDYKTVVNSEVVDKWVSAVNLSNTLFPKIEEIFRGHLGLKSA